MNMNYLIKKVFVPFVVAIVCCVSLFYSWKSFVENHFDVPGTVIAKSEAVRGEHRRVRTDWLLAVRPDDTTYRAYDVNVDFVTYATTKVGDHVSFNVISAEVDPNGHDDFISIALGVIGVVGLFGLFIYKFS